MNWKKYLGAFILVWFTWTALAGLVWLVGCASTAPSTPYANFFCHMEDGCGAYPPRSPYAEYCGRPFVVCPGDVRDPLHPTQVEPAEPEGGWSKITGGEGSGEIDVSTETGQNWHAGDAFKQRDLIREPGAGDPVVMPSPQISITPVLPPWVSTSSLMWSDTVYHYSQ